MKAPACKVEKCSNRAEGSGSGRGMCPRCYRRALRVEAGTARLAPGEVAIGASKGARELRALVDGKVAKAFSHAARKAKISETDLLRFVVGRFLSEPRSTEDLARMVALARENLDG